MILVKKFGANRLFFCKQKSELAICSVKTNNLLIRSFIMSNLTESLFWHERPERLTYNHSFVLSNLSKWLTVTHLIWAIWANERMSQFPTLVSTYFFFFRDTISTKSLTSRTHRQWLRGHGNRQQICDFHGTIERKKVLGCIYMSNSNIWIILGLPKRLKLRVENTKS